MTENITMKHEDIHTEQFDTLRPISDEEGFAPKQKIDVEAKTIEATFAFRAAEGTQRYEKTVMLDFSDVSQEKLLDLALYEVKQKVQGMLRKAGDKMLLRETYSYVNVQNDIIAHERAPAGPQLTKVAKELGMTPAEAARILLAHKMAEAVANSPQPAEGGLLKRKGGKK